jgi:hypothetical protein
MAMAKKILTIDGGGIRGAFAAAIIERIEQVLGKKARDYFDGFYGTSTGAILAAGLAKGMPASDLKRFYLEKGAKVFTKLPFYRVVKRNLFWTYSKEHLEKELIDVFGELKIFEVDRLLSIQAKDTETSTAVFYNNFPRTQQEHPERNGLVREIIRASTAAPTFFQSEGNRYIDGGISSYNNCSYAAFIGATKYLGWPTGVDNLRIYSVGTGYLPPVIPKGALDLSNKIVLAAYMVGELMDDINLLQNQIMGRLEKDRKECWYRRYTVKFDERSFNNFGLPTEGIDFKTLASIDGVKLVRQLAEIGERVASKLVVGSDFP